MINEGELFVRQQLLAIIKRLDEMDCKIDKILMSEQLMQESCTTTTDVNQISQVVRARLSKALARKRAKAVSEMNE